MNNSLKATNPCASAFVSASAGTGKTKLLTDRVLRLLLDDNKPHKILCITFTKAAAAEMQHRIFNELISWATIDETELKERLQNMIGEIPTAKQMEQARGLLSRIIDSDEQIKIKTIHSLSEYILNLFPIEAGITPGSKVIDDHKVREVFEEAWNKMLKEIMGDREPTLHEALKLISINSSDDRLVDFLLNEIVSSHDKFQDMIDAYGSYENATIAIYKELGVLGKTIEQEEIEFEAQINWAEMERLARAIDERGKLNTDLVVVPKIRQNTVASYVQIFLTKKNEPRKSIVTKEFEEFRDFLSKEQARVLEFCELKKSLMVAELTKSLLIVSEELHKNYEQIKREYSYLDYADLISKASKLLSEKEDADWVRFKLDGGIDHILVDESQDTSPRQWQIIYSLCEEFYAGLTAQEMGRTLFIVGDEKQSIYSFQGADPQIFEYVRGDLKSKLHNSKTEFFDLDLEFSYRSGAAILEFVDRLFSGLPLSRAVGSKAVLHKVKRDKSSSSVELWPLVFNEKEEDEGFTIPVEMKFRKFPRKILAELIASKIEAWLKGDKPLLAKGRRLAAGDIMILVRKRTKFVDHLVSALKHKNIPVSGIDRIKLKENIAILDLVALGKFLLLPQDDLNFACLLKSPLFVISEDELFELAYNRDQKDLWGVFKESPKYKESVAYLSDLLNKTDYFTPFNLYNYVLEETGGRRKFISRLGEECLDPIDEFISLLANYEQENIASMQGFINWFGKTDIEIKRDLEASGGKIRIMTIHASKGLQAPLVILADTGSLDYRQRSSLFWESNLVYYSGSSGNNNDKLENLKEFNKQSAFDEYYRLLYVALTRAEDHLIICGIEKEAKDGSWYKICQGNMEKFAKKMPFTVDVEFKSFLRDDFKYVADYNFFEEVSEGKGQEQVEVPEILHVKYSEEIIADYISEIDETGNEDSMKRGVIIHKLLEFLPQIEEAQRAQFAKSLLAQIGGDIKKSEFDDIVSNATQLINKPELQILFGPNSKSEVPIVGLIDRAIKNQVLGRVDRLAVTESEVHIADFKTGEYKEKIPSNYLSQLETYASILKNIYPNKEIKAYIIWVDSLQITEIKVAEPAL